MSLTTYTRFALSERLEHILALSSFTVLAVTGLPQKFAAVDWARAMIGAMGGIEATRQIHHIAAIVLMLETVYHVVGVGYRMFVKRTRFTMLPSKRDVDDALGAFLYNLGLRKEKPQAGRYTYEEKAEYWAFVWGTVIMVITGFMMWNPIATTSFFPGQIIPAAKAAHGGEALLAVLAIIIWHMYGVHLRHFNKSMWTGKLTEQEMAKEHPLELADLKAGIAERPVGPSALKRRQQLYYPVAGVLAAGLLLGVYRFTTLEETAINTAPRREQIAAFDPLTPTPLPTPRPTATPAALRLVWAENIGLMLENKCTSCHGGIAGLDFSSYTSTLKGGKNGRVILPGDPDHSLIIQKQSKKHPGQLSDSELKALTEWVAAGAPEK